MNQNVVEGYIANTRLHETIFDAIPSAIFVLNPSMAIEDFNDAAIELPEDVLLDTVRPDWEGERIGDVLACIDSTAGCGNSPACRNCELLNGIRAASAGTPYRKVLATQFRKNGTLVPAEYLMTAKSFKNGGETLVLLVLDNVANWLPQGIVQARPATVAGTQ